MTLHDIGAGETPRLDASSATPPRAEPRPTLREYHGRALSDPYSWLAAENWRAVLRDGRALPKDIAALLKAENAYCDRVMAPLKSLRETLVAEMRGRIKEDDADPPWPDGPFAYFARYREGGEHPLYCRTKRGGGDEEILLDGDALAEASNFSTSARRFTRPTTRNSAGASTIRAPSSIPSARAR